MAVAAIAAVSVGLSVVGTMVQMEGQKDAAAASQEKIQEEQKRADLEAMRRRREMARRAQVAMAVAQSNAVSGGTDASSGLFGGYAQISGEMGRSVMAINQEQEISHNITDINQKIADAQSTVATGQGISSLAGSLSSIGGSDAFDRITGGAAVSPAPPGRLRAHRDQPGPTVRYPARGLHGARPSHPPAHRFEYHTQPGTEYRPCAGTHHGGPLYGYAHCLLGNECTHRRHVDRCQHAQRDGAGRTHSRRLCAHRDQPRSAVRYTSGGLHCARSF